MIIAAVILFCAGVIWFADHYRSRSVATKEALLARLPGKDALILSIDFAALRRAGLMDLLESSRTPEEPEYKEFVAKTDFDYKEDLDLALASFAPNGRYFLLVGRFDWNKLYAYARAEGGTCYNAACQMNGSVPDRKISFAPLRKEIMALVVSNDSYGASQLAETPGTPRPVEARPDPVWISFAGSAIQKSDKLPTGTAIFAKALADADEVVVSVGPRGEDFQANLSVNCRTETDASGLVRELENDTNLLRSLIARENRSPNPNDLSGVLTSGTFSARGRQVSGHWPITKTLVRDTLTGGS